LIENLTSGFSSEAASTSMSDGGCSEGFAMVPAVGERARPRYGSEAETVATLGSVGWVSAAEM
jgi:hypothetical protein